MVTFTCPRCSKRLEAQNPGTLVTCPLCEAAVKVPHPPAVALAPIDFACPRCDKHIRAHGSMVGLRVPCPLCQARVEVPRPRIEVIVETEVAGPSASQSREVPAPTWIRYGLPVVAMAVAGMLLLFVSKQARDSLDDLIPVSIWDMVQEQRNEQSSP